MRKGQVIIAAIFVLAIIAILAMVAVALLSGESVSAVKNYHGIQALNVAEGGVRFTITASLAADSDWSDNVDFGPVSLNPGTFTVRYLSKAQRTCSLEVTGTVNGVSRTIRTSLRKTAGGISSILGDYVIYWGGSGGSGSTIGNNSTIIGDIFTNNTLTAGNNVTISGDAQSTGAINYGSGSSISGTEEEYVAPPYDPPTLETTYYDNLIATAATYPSGNQSWNSRTISGETYIHGNLTINQNETISLTGLATVAVTGTVLVRNNAVIGDNFKLIAGGKVTIENNVTLGKHQFWYSSVGFDVGNNAEAGDVSVGEGTVFITPGDIDFGNNIEYYGFIFCGGDFIQTGNNFYFEGNIIVGGDISVDENSTLKLNPTLVDASELTGITSGGSSTESTSLDSSWEEVF